MSFHPVLSRRSSMLLAAAMAVSGPALAQTAPEPANVVSLSASAFKDVPEDWLTMVVRATADASDAVSAQNQLKLAVEAALATLRPQAQPQQMEVRTGSFGIYPRHNNQGRVIGWQGSAEVVIEGRDFARYKGFPKIASSLHPGLIAKRSTQVFECRFSIQISGSPGAF